MNKIEKKLNVKNRIMLKAAELFYSQGILATGINQIIREADVAKASFYHYFPSKNHLVVECVKIYEVFVAHRIGNIIKSSHSFSDFIIEWINSIKREIKLREEYNACPLAEAAFQADSAQVMISKTISDSVESWTIQIAEFFLRLKRYGELPDNTDPDILARRVLQLHEGSLAMWKLTRNIEHIDDLKFFAEKLLVK